MRLLDWSPELETGHAGMDATHRGFVDRLNTLHATRGEDLLPLLDALIEHTAAHFEQEQRWMQEIDFPPARTHAGEHEGVLDIMFDARRMAGAENAADLGRALARELASWFVNHVRGLDATLAFFLRCVDDGVDPIQQLAQQAGERPAP